MKIVVETTTQMQFTLEVEPSDTIADLKAQIQAKEGILMEDQLLLLNNSRLQDDRKLSDYGSEKEAFPRLKLHIYETWELNEHLTYREYLQRQLEILKVIHKQQNDTDEQIRTGLKKEFGLFPPEDPVQIIRSNQDKSDLPPGLRFRGRDR
ncbi:Ubiquitin-like protein [Aphelenchoides besseyi]|nr:Ubiquitin-like protein [Aphelenchoides besseyi]KAI6211806.1 Ubiquitin-like protein [Aphelenchoides besseyi]